MDEKQEPPLTETAVRDLARSKSYERGESYYERGAVGAVVRRGTQLRAEVEGSQYQPYSVTIEFDEAGIAHTACTCPYDYGGICKHRVAVLLTYIRDSDRITHGQPVSELIRQADRETLEDVLVELVDRRPELAQWVETRLKTSAVADEATASSTVSINLDSVRAQAEHALPKPGQRGHSDAYAEARRMAEQLDELLEQVRIALDAGDGETALDVLRVVTEVLVEENWTGLLPHDVPTVYETIDDLCDLFTEALLTADLDGNEREEWERRLREWDSDTVFRHFMGRPMLGPAADAALEGWDDDRIQQAMQGAFDHGEFWEDSSGWYDEGVIDARLDVLENRGDIDGYLNLSLATGHDTAHATMLVRDGRIEDAIEYGIDHLSTPETLFELARTLRENGETTAALTVAEHGLTVDGYLRSELATWLRDCASSAGEDELALEAAIVAFEENPSLSAHQAVEEIAGDDWERVRDELLAVARQRSDRYVSGTVEVFLHEGLYDEAIELADASGRADVIEQVVEAVSEQRPEWAIEVCKAQAAPIIENGQHDRYRTAVRWLDRAGSAAREANRLDEWRSDVETIREEHYRKYKLRPMLDDLLEDL